MEKRSQNQRYCLHPPPVCRKSHLDSVCCHARDDPGSLKSLLNKEEGLDGRGDTGPVHFDWTRAERLDSDLTCIRSHWAPMQQVPASPSSSPAEQSCRLLYALTVFLPSDSLWVSDVTVRHESGPSFLDYLNNSHFVAAYGMFLAEQCPFIWQF